MLCVNIQCNISILFSDISWILETRDGDCIDAGIAGQEKSINALQKRTCKYKMKNI